MSFLTRTSPLARRVAVSTRFAPRAFSTTYVQRKSATETVKDAAKSVDRAISDKLVDGIEAGENASQKVKEAVQPAADKAAELTGQAKGKAAELSGEAKGKANELAGEAKGAANSANRDGSILSGETKGAASELVGEAKGKANELAGAAKGKKEEIKGKL